MPDSPENPRILKIGSSTPRIYQLPFEEAVRRMVLGERSQAAVQTSFEDNDFYVPNTVHFRLDAVYSSEPIIGVNVTRGGYTIRVSDADYVMYEGETRMNGHFLGQQRELGDRFLIMQSFLDPDTYLTERNRVAQSFPPMPIQAAKSSKQNKAS